MSESRHHHRIKTAKDKYLEQGETPEGLVSESIHRSWERCLKQGLINDTPPYFEPITGHNLNELRDKNALLIQRTQAELETLYSHIAGTQSMVILSDAQGVILNAAGNADFMSKAQQVALQPGVSWNESMTGTNAIGTAIIENTPVLVKGAEHFLECNGFLNCSASPIHDPFGNILGVLDLSGDYRQPHDHTLGLIKMSVQMIENKLFNEQFSEDIVLHFHARKEFLGTMWEGIIVCSLDGKIIAANQSGLFQLNLPESYHGVPIEHVFETDISGLIALGRKNTSSLPNKVRLRNGNAVCIVLEMPKNERKQIVSSPSASPTLESPFKALEALDTGDEKIHGLIEKLKQAVHHDIPILIEGETGTGKELFAQAIHASGPKRNGPFIAINCAAIPEGLIESELFGHEEGAFTGARKRGAIGRIQQAHGGTLFLDEVGEMPLAMQARLLRVLQSKEVTPLGGAKSFKVDISIVSATNVSLKEQLSKRLFREDLYYRLHGFKVTLLPLRQRSDLSVLISRIFRDQLNLEGIVIDEEVNALFRRHTWPGNVRELFHVLQAAKIFMRGNVLKKEHLPEEFLEELLQRPSINTPAHRGPSIRPSAVTAPLAISDHEKVLIDQAIRANYGHLGTTAKQLGISRATLYRKIKKWGLKPHFSE